MLTAVVLGGAACLHDDLARALKLFTPDVWIATNHAGRDTPGIVDHWVSMHPDLMPRWIAERARASREPAGQLWTAWRRRQPTLPDLEFKVVENWGGSSGMLAVTVALEVGCDRIVLCGVPMDAKQGHYNDPKPWKDALQYRKAWMDRAPGLSPKVRSMSGDTREWLGAPTAEWFDEARNGSPDPAHPGSVPRPA